MLKILQARLQRYVNHELPDAPTGFRKCRGTRDKNCQHPLDYGKAREFQKNTFFCFIDYAKAFDCVDHKKLWKILQEMGMPDHLTCLLRNLHACQEATVRTRRGTTDCFRIGKGVRQGYILSPDLFNLYAKWMWKSLSCVRLFVTPWTVVQGILQARILEWVAFPFSRGSSQPGIEPRSPTLQGDSLPAETQGKPLHHEKCRAGWSTSWNQDCGEKYQ